ncbi:DUF805 domain-containing protein [Aurantiacibacter spongiae]|uniref:DUF805 domain-containing protein n=1 Tax=Aurantiacibacter spongiae TaxID=2488860 RepID=A0A3N5CSF4_9SPHN|nr:DUF805 domain-containing protein [Aurantiacibacter spongiae]RPF72093.1 DUF805 domain-containing protein [Aurantiacibacter spongiae]
MNWMILPLKRYAEFTGRSRRKEYWMFVLLNVIVVVVLSFIAGIVGTGINTVANGDPTSVLGFFTGGVGLLLGLYFLAILIPSIAVSVRRLHDRNMSGWWYLGFVVLSLVPFVGFIASIAMLVIFALPGTDGPNRYGPDPKDPSQVEAFT